MTQTQKAPPDPNRPRTLAAAIERIKQLTTGSTAKPITPAPATPELGPAKPVPKPVTPNPSTGVPAQGLSDMAPKPLGDYLENRSDRELELLLGRETGKDRKHQDARIVQGIYAEIRKRRKS